MKTIKTALLSATLLSLTLIGQTAIAGDSPRDQAISGNSATEQYQFATPESSTRINYSVSEADLNNLSDIFTDNEH